MDAPLAIVILSFNKQERTARAVRETRELVSTWSTPHFIILVHNGSLAHHVEQLRTEFSEIDHLVLGENIGFSGGMNAGLARAFSRSTWALALSNDCALITEPSPSLYDSPALIAPRVFRRKSGQVESCGGYCDWKSAQLRHARTAEEFQRVALGRRYVPGSCFLIHHEIFIATAGFDTSLHTYWEDVDLSLRATQSGLRLRTAEDWQVRHDIGRTCHGDPLYTLYFFQRNRIRTLIKFAPKLYLPWIMARLALDFLRLWNRLRGHRVHDRAHLLRAARHGFHRRAWNPNLPSATARRLPQPLPKPTVPPMKKRVDTHPPT